MAPSNATISPFGPAEVRAWRAGCGLTQTAAARALGITRVHFVFMEVGHRYDTARTPVRVTMTMRLAMAAVAKGLPPCGESRSGGNRWLKVRLMPKTDGSGENSPQKLARTRPSESAPLVG